MGVYRDLNDYEIMYLIEEQDESAKELLFEKYRPIVLKIASYYKSEAKKCGLEMDDLVQEGYLGLYGAIQTFDSSNNVLFYTYALVSVRSKILNVLTIRNAVKHRTLNESVSLSKPISGGDEGSLIDVLEDKSALMPHLMVEENEIERIIHDFILSLEFSHALIFELKMNGFKNSDIVQLLDIQLKTVSNILFQIRKKLREYLEIYT